MKKNIFIFIFIFSCNKNENENKNEKKTTPIASISKKKSNSALNEKDETYNERIKPYLEVNVWYGLDGLEHKTCHEELMETTGEPIVCSSIFSNEEATFSDKCKEYDGLSTTCGSCSVEACSINVREILSRDRLQIEKSVKLWYGLDGLEHKTCHEELIKSDDDLSCNNESFEDKNFYNSCLKKGGILSKCGGCNISACSIKPYLNEEDIDFERSINIWYGLDGLEHKTCHEKLIKSDDYELSCHYNYNRASSSKEGIKEKLNILGFAENCRSEDGFVTFCGSCEISACSVQIESIK